MTCGYFHILVAIEKIFSKLSVWICAVRAQIKVKWATVLSTITRRLSRIARINKEELVLILRSRDKEIQTLFIVLLILKHFVSKRCRSACKVNCLNHNAQRRCFLGYRCSVFIYTRKDKINLDKESVVLPIVWKVLQGLCRVVPIKANIWSCRILTCFVNV